MYLQQINCHFVQLLHKLSASTTSGTIPIDVDLGLENYNLPRYLHLVNLTS
jgi:hypothetical protein